MRRQDHGQHAQDHQQADHRPADVERDAEVEQRDPAIGPRVVGEDRVRDDDEERDPPELDRLPRRGLEPEPGGGERLEHPIVQIVREAHTLIFSRELLKSLQEIEKVHTHRGLARNDICQNDVIQGKIRFIQEKQSSLEVFPQHLYG